MHTRWPPTSPCLPPKSRAATTKIGRSATAPTTPPRVCRPYFVVQYLLYSRVRTVVRSIPSVLLLLLLLYYVYGVCAPFPCLRHFWQRIALRRRFKGTKPPSTGWLVP